MDFRASIGRKPWKMQDGTDMTVRDLINKLSKYDLDLPICINDYMGFVETNEECIQIEQKEYQCFPFTENDRFKYINLKSIEEE